MGDLPPIPFLNDCLFTNANPAMMSRYQIRFGEHCEDHRSSGLWVSTAGGATGAIASAGLTCEEPLNGPTLLFRVRELFHQPHSQPQLQQAITSPPQPLTLVPLIPNMMCYLDGAHRYQLPCPTGTRVRIAAHPHDVQLVS